MAGDKKSELFEVTGTYLEAKTMKKFTKRVEAFNEKHAMERIMSLIGSKHKTKRKDIKITEAKKAEGR
ncbi:MAG: 50S ribosomal protein L18Ae [Candidatus Diapherotrites archaeon]